MRPWVRRIAVVSLLAWLLSGSLGQLLWLHVEAEHVGHQHHHESRAGTTLLLHPDAGLDHEHQLSSSMWLPLLPGSRLQAQAPVLAILADQWSPAHLAFDRPAPDPRPRGRPFTLEHLTILLI